MENNYKDKLKQIYIDNANDERKKGRPCYLINCDKLISNYKSLLNSFTKHYQNTRIAYSYKTNDTKYILELLRDLGAYAEVVSEKERKEAVAVGMETKDIIFNGVTDDIVKKKTHIIRSGIVNIDSLEALKAITEDGLIRGRNIGLRISLGKDYQSISRFGLNNDELFEAIKICKEKGINISGIQCHVGGSRNLESWKYRTETMIATAWTIERSTGHVLDYIDLGGHLYGNMDRQLASQFEGDIPTFQEYAEVVGDTISKAYRTDGPQLILEPGTALVGDAVSILAKVVDAKKRDGKIYATLDVSSFDCGMVADYKNLTIENLSNDNNGQNCVVFGYTCMEQDLINRNYNGCLEAGDIVQILNTGAYSASMKGPFICNPINTVVIDSNMNTINAAEDRT